MQHLSRFTIHPAVVDGISRDVRQYLKEVAFQYAPADKAVVESTDSKWQSHLHSIAEKLFDGVSDVRLIQSRSCDEKQVTYPRPAYLIPLVLEGRGTLNDVPLVLGDGIYVDQEFSLAQQGIFIVVIPPLMRLRWVDPCLFNLEPGVEDLINKLRAWLENEAFAGTDDGKGIAQSTHPKLQERLDELFRAIFQGVLQYKLLHIRHRVCHRDSTRPLYYIPLLIKGHPTVGGIPLAIGSGVYSNQECIIDPDAVILGLMPPRMRILWKEKGLRSNSDWDGVSC
ncbi:hypothetical protein VTN00DRAFT_2740 [Thermoascus crustaceus]|uniref:uncharacterized protein n=1 Tax=Thermoascus crustaceus TaxID=5088 RepID=UPI0037434D32